MRGFAVVLALAVSFVSAPLAFAQADANLTDLAWLEGRWEGRGIDGAPATEVYSRAAGGKMVGHFRQLKPDGSVLFYELITIGIENGKLTYALKHFNPDLTGWEERDTVVRFPLTAVAPGKWNFSGITYERKGTNSMTASVAVNEKDGSTQMLVFHFRRK
jgi:hypothetical protein